MKIMIVDDSAAMRRMIRSVLDSAATTFYECSDGCEVVPSYEEFRPDYVLMDIKLKVMDGFQATKQIIAKFPDARIVMVTQYDEPMLKERAKKIGAIDFVLKENLYDIGKIIRNIEH